MEKVSFEHYGLILIMDVKMPGNGWVGSHKNDTPLPEMHAVIIAMDANTMQGGRGECIQSGMNDYTASLPN